MFGEKYDYDPNFDALPVAYTSGLKMNQWAQWGFTGGLKATGHVTPGDLARNQPDGARLVLGFKWLWLPR